MNLRYIKTLAIAGLTILATGCSDNSWNDTFLDGFHGGASYDTPATVYYTLTNTDYETIGKALSNIAITQAEKDAAKFIQENHYFDQLGPYPAKVAVPYLLNQEKTDFYIYNINSVVNVSLLQADVPKPITKISGAQRFFLLDPTDPKTIPSYLNTAYPDALEDTYAIVSYEPVVPASAPAKTKSQPGKFTINKMYAPSRAGQAWTVGEALNKMNDGYEGYAFVKGIVSQIDELSTQFGNATYYIKDSLDDEDSLEVYRGYGQDGAKFTSADQLTVGMNVIVEGTLQNYNNTTFEFTAGSKIISEANIPDNFPPTDTPDNPSGGDQPGEDENPGEGMETLTDVITDLSVGKTITATAMVTAQAANGIVLSDNGGSIFYYNPGINLKQYSVGTIVMILNGVVSVNNYGYQISNVDFIAPVGEGSYAYPTPKPYNGPAIDAACASTENFQPEYVTFEGTLAISNNYYNVIVNKATCQGSLYQLTDEMKAKLEDGKYYQFRGFFTSVSAGKYFNIVVTSAYETEPTIDESTLLNVVYYYDGDEWTPYENATVMNAPDYEALGFEPNTLIDPAIYLPEYMQMAFPHVAPGTSYYVAYNLGKESCSCALLEYNGYWLLNDSFVKERTAAFSKKAAGYAFSKYIDEAVYNLFEQDEIIRNRSYIMVSQGVCADPVPLGKGYDYLPSTPVSELNKQIIMNNENNAFYFASSFENNEGETIYAPDGYFLIIDSNGRYMYSYNNNGNPSDRINADNVGYLPSVSNGKITDAYLFTAKKQDDGTWKISNYLFPDNPASFYYSPNYGTWGFYTASSKYVADSFLPVLFIMQTDD